MTTPISFDVWAPKAHDVTLVADGEQFPLQRDDFGWYRPTTPLPERLFRTGIDYGYLLDDADRPLPDPRTRWQPNGPHELSRTFDPSDYEWHDDEWTGRQFPGCSIYELHVGTFTPGPDGTGGTLDSAIERLDHLVEMGFTFVELMPVNTFNGHHGWGYDGVDWFAVHPAYGGPAAYQRFVDAAHQRGLAVIQDVVYNHLGPSGNYLPQFGPYFKEGTSNPWGESINLDGDSSDEIRRYIVDNAMSWVTDFHVDGLRLDAVHALVDTRAVHILEEIAVETEALSVHVGRPLSLIAESDLNDPRLITPREAGGYALTAQWNDDFHHALLANLTGNDAGYYADFATLDALAKVLETGFYHDGTLSTFRGRRHGRPLDTTRTPTWRFVECSDNHDQIGNRHDGARLAAKFAGNQLIIAAALTLLGPCTPMVFMGEEWGATTPFAFFTSHPEADLAEAVRQGRIAEFARMNWDTDEIPDPQADSTFTGSMLDWSELEQPEHREVADAYREFLRLRSAFPEFTDPRWDTIGTLFDANSEWFVLSRAGRSIVAVNFGTHATTISLPDGEWHSEFLRSAELREAAPAAAPLAEETEQTDAAPSADVALRSDRSAGEATATQTLVLGPHAVAVIRLRDVDEPIAWAGSDGFALEAP